MSVALDLLYASELRQLSQEVDTAVASKFENRIGILIK